jgi:O-antigen/teichoic acid export membrane protein
VGLILAGMLARYFTPEEFGLWSILISLNGVLLSGFDFGFGNALRNRMAQLYAGRYRGCQDIKYLVSYPTLES